MPQARLGLVPTIMVHGCLVHGHHMQQLTRSIQWKELFAILAAVATWGQDLKCQRILFHYDNLTVVHSYLAGKETWKLPSYVGHYSSWLHKTTSLLP